MREKCDYYTTYFKGHASHNDDNPAVKHKYIDVLLELKEWKKRKETLSVSF